MRSHPEVLDGRKFGAGEHYTTHYIEYLGTTKDFGMIRLPIVQVFKSLDQLYSKYV